MNNVKNCKLLIAVQWNATHPKPLILELWPVDDWGKIEEDDKGFLSAKLFSWQLGILGIPEQLGTPSAAAWWIQPHVYIPS